ncbi:MAG: 3-deoxy-manno-octulosonate cytidylyltransferase [Nitrospira bacterium SG8_35_1]|nr:MAG: 3-deoxy-manno-octulosonate cytidylyltransferase [Nitrospira bacterium SG8_35_1]
MIPARYNSSRFPGKPLATLKGKTLIQNVYDQASSASRIDSVIVATDDARIFDSVKKFGGSVLMTSPDHSCGTDRIAEVARDLECDIVVNVQGDEPFIRPEMIDDTVQLLLEDEAASISTLAVRIDNEDEIVNPNVVKVVTDDRGYALYFSRSPIPYFREEWKDLQSITLQQGKTVLFKHIGVYGYRKESLLNFTAMEKKWLEEMEKLEQLRALAAGMKIKVKETAFNTFGIDTIEDLRKAEEWQSISL